MVDKPEAHFNRMRKNMPCTEPHSARRQVVEDNEDDRRSAHAPVCAISMSLGQVVRLDVRPSFDSDVNDVRCPA